MVRKFHPSFDQMDELSQTGTPYFFLVDFLMENVEVFTEEELDKPGLLIDFQKFKKTNEPLGKPLDISFQSFPQSEESYRKGFDLVQKKMAE